MMPVMARNLLESIRLLSTSSTARWRSAASTASPPTPSGCGATPSRRRPSSRPLNKHVGYEAGGQDRQAGAGRRRHDPRDRDRDGVRRPRRPHRAAARRRPRRGADDPPVNQHRRPGRTSARSTPPRTTSRPAGPCGSPPPTACDPETEALRAIDRALVGDARVLEVGCGTGVMAERIHGLPGRHPGRHRLLAALRRAHRGPWRRRPAGRHLLPAVRGRRPSTWSTRAGCSTTCATSSGRSTRSAGCCARAARSSPSPTATTTSPTCARTPAAGRPSQPVQQRDRRVRPAAPLRRRTPPRPRDARGLPRPRQRPGLPRLDRRRPRCCRTFEGGREYAGEVTVFEAR